MKKYIKADYIHHLKGSETTNKNGKITKYIKTWVPGHYGEAGFHATALWEKADLEVYVYATNHYVKAVKIGDELYELDMKNPLRIVPGVVDDEEAENYLELENGTVTDYTSF